MKIFSDETLLQSPIKSSMNYAWTAMRNNWIGTLWAALIFVVIMVASAIPLIGLIASVAQGILFYSLGYWIVDRIKSSDSIAGFAEKIQTDSVGAMLTEKLAPATGFYVGFMIFSLLMSFMTLAILWATGGFSAITLTMQQSTAQMTPEQMQLFYAQILSASTPALAFMLISALFFGYIWPLVYGYALLQKSFGDAFNAVFMLFSPRFWRAAFTGRYFVTVTLWTLVVLGVGLATGICMAVIFLIPLGILLLMWLIYFSATLSAATYNFSEGI